MLEQALTAAREALYQRSRADQETLALLAETALHHELDPGASGERYQVVIHVDASALADPDQPGQSVLEDGAHVSAETSRRLACDASRVLMRHDPDERELEVGARTRTIPPALRRALQHRDRGCRFPGCGGRFTQGHHLRHWAQGGPTTLSNLVLLCRRHHRAVHEDGYRVARARRRAPVPAAGRRLLARGAAIGRRCLPIRPPRSGRVTMRRGCASTRGRAQRVAGGAAGCGLGDRRPASAGEAPVDVPLYGDEFVAVVTVKTTIERSSCGEEPRLGLAKDLRRLAENLERGEAAGAHDLGSRKTSGLLQSVGAGAGELGGEGAERGGRRRRQVASQPSCLYSKASARSARVRGARP